VRSKQAQSFDHLVGKLLQVQRHVEIKRFAVLRFITSSNLVGCSTFSSRRSLVARADEKNADARKERRAGRQHRGHHRRVYRDIVENPIDHHHDNCTTEQRPQQKKQCDKPHCVTPQKSETARSGII
jgi:hypothetical protein